MANKIISVSISSDLADKLMDHAWDHDVTTSQYIRGLIEQDLKPRQKERAISLEESLLKENAGLRLNLYKYKRKYKALNRILCGGLCNKIHECKSLIVSFTKRGNRAEAYEEKKICDALIRHIQGDKADLERIYEMCVEAIKD